MNAEGWIAVSLGVAGIAGTLIGSTLGYQSGTASVNKDYVQMAITNLDRKDASPELRKWSVDVLSKLSPVPFGKKLENQLAAGPAPIISTRYIWQPIKVPAEFTVRCPDVMKGWGHVITDDQAMKVVRQYNQCRIRHDALIDTIGDYNKIAAEFTAKQNKIDAELQAKINNTGK